MGLQDFLQTAGGGAMGAGVVGAVGSLIGGIGQGRKAYHRSKRLMGHQLDLSKQMYDYQNMYNTPTKQMERLKAAGLNPALMYGQGTTGNASGAPQAQINSQNPYVSSQDISAALGQGVNIALASSQKNLLEANATAARAKALYDTKKGFADIKDSNTRRMAYEHTQTYQMAQLANQTLSVTADVNLKREQQAGQIISNNIQNKTSQFQIGKWEKDFALAATNASIAEGDLVIKNAEAELAKMKIPGFKNDGTRSRFFFSILNNIDRASINGNFKKAVEKFLRPVNNYKNYIKNKKK